MTAGSDVGATRDGGILVKSLQLRDIEDLRALEFTVSLQEGAIKGPAGRAEELERRHFRDGPSP